MMKLQASNVKDHIHNFMVYFGWSALSKDRYFFPIDHHGSIDLIMADSNYHGHIVSIIFPQSTWDWFKRTLWKIEQPENPKRTLHVMGNNPTMPLMGKPAGAAVRLLRRRQASLSECASVADQKWWFFRNKNIGFCKKTWRLYGEWTWIKKVK